MHWVKLCRVRVLAEDLKTVMMNDEEAGIHKKGVGRRQQGLVNCKLQPFKYPPVKVSPGKVAQGAQLYSREYLQPQGLELRHTGLHVDPNVPFMGCTPHRVVVPHGAPRDARPTKLLHVRHPANKRVPFVPADTDVIRCTCEMALTGVDECDLLYIGGGDHRVFALHMTPDKRVEWEDVIVPVAKAFLFKHVVPPLARHVLQLDRTMPDPKKLIGWGPTRKRINYGSPKAKCKDMVHISEIVPDHEFSKRCTWLETWNNRPEWTKKSGSGPHVGRGTPDAATNNARDRMMAF